MSVQYLGAGYQGDKYLGEKYQVNGTTFYVYYPKNVSENSTVDGTLYYTGAGGYSAESDANILTELYNNNKNMDYVYISPSYTSWNTKPEVVDALLEYISDPNSDNPHHYNITINDVGGFSLGGGKGTKDFVNLLHTEYSKSDDVEQKKLILYDPYGYGSGERPTYSPTFTDEDIALMKKNNSQVVLFTNDTRMAKTGQANDYPVRYANDALTTLAKNDVGTAIISSNIGHGSMANEINRDGWKLYFDGKIELEDIKNGEYTDSRTLQNKTQCYTVTVPTKNDDGIIIWKTYKLSDLVAAKTTSGTHDPEITSALNYVESLVVKANFNYVDQANELITELAKLTQNEKAIISYSSKSALLPQENTILSKVTTLIENLQVACTAEIRNILYAGSEYKSLDKKLSLDAESFSQVLNENIQSYRVPMVTLNTSAASGLEDAKLYTTTDLTNKSVYDRANLTADDINMIIDSELKGEDSVLSGTGKYWIEASNKTGLDPLFLLALARQESGLGTSDYAKNYNNFFGMKYQAGVQYFGVDRNGNNAEKMYADTPEEGIIKASEWIKEFYVGEHGGKTTYKFGQTGYSGNHSYSTILPSIMSRMKNTYETTTGNSLSFIDASSSGNVSLSTETTATTVPTQISTSTPSTPTTVTATTPSTPVTPSTPTTITTPTAPTTPTVVTTTTPSTPATPSTPTTTTTPTTPSTPTTSTETESPTIEPTIIEEPTIETEPEIDVPTISTEPEPTIIETTPTEEIVSTPEPEVTVESETPTEIEVASESEISSEPATSQEVESDAIPETTIQSEIDSEPESTTEVTPEPDVPIEPDNHVESETADNNDILRTVGIAAGIGAATAASIYGAKKIKDKIEEKDEV